MSYQNLRCVGRISGIETFVAHIRKTFVELFARDVECIAKVSRIESLDIAWHKHNVVCRLVEYDKFAVTVVDESSGRINGFL